LLQHTIGWKGWTERRLFLQGRSCFKTLAWPNVEIDLHINPQYSKFPYLYADMQICPWEDKMIDNRSFPVETEKNLVAMETKILELKQSYENKDRVAALELERDQANTRANASENTCKALETEYIRVLNLKEQNKARAK
jgi:hypothetical protein